jgi:hypothetical protein
LYQRRLAIVDQKFGLKAHKSIDLWPVELKLNVILKQL